MHETLWLDLRKATFHADTLFTIKRKLHTLTNNSTRESFPGCFCCSLFLWLVDIHKCSGCPQMASHPLDNHTASCNSPHNWLMSLIMDLATLCDMWRWNGTNGYYLAAFTFAHHFVANHPSPPSHSIGVLVVLATLVKMRVIQLAIRPVVGE